MGVDFLAAQLAMLNSDRKMAIPGHEFPPLGRNAGGGRHAAGKQVLADQVEQPGRSAIFNGV
jgi:hypothetical protein